jgi:hypothetical protein
MRRIVPLLVIAFSLIANSAHAEAGKKNREVAFYLSVGGTVASLFGGIALLSAEDLPEGPRVDGDLGLVALAAGGAVWVGSTVYDWYDAPRTADRKNARFMVMPSALPAKGGPAPGLVLAGTF